MQSCLCRGQLGLNARDLTRHFGRIDNRQCLPGDNAIPFLDQNPLNTSGDTGFDIDLCHWLHRPVLGDFNRDGALHHGNGSVDRDWFLRLTAHTVGPASSRDENNRHKKKY